MVSGGGKSGCIAFGLVVLVFPLSEKDFLQSVGQEAVGSRQ